MAYLNKDKDKDKMYKVGDIFKLKLNQINYRNELYSFFIKKNALSLPFMDTETNELCFHAKSVIPLSVLLKKQKYKLTEKQVLCMIQSLSYQIKWMEDQNLTFLGWNLEDIIVIDDFYFFIATNRFLRPLDSKNGFIDLLTPAEKPYFSSPELHNVNKLPALIYYKSCYYSLGLLVVFCLLGEYLLKGNDVPSQEHIENILKPIRFSKLYWFLLRCFDNEAENRWLIYT